MAINSEHLQINIKGFVQGLGFRPFVVRLARQFQQNGWVANTPAGLTIAIEGDTALQRQFLHNLNTQLPPLADIKSLALSKHPLAYFTGFEIKASTVDGNKSVFILPDIASCPECVGDIFNPASRFYQYPFTSCSHCGPRYSITHQQPYDRAQTSMAQFQICGECAQDYQAIDNRRFHAQTIACPNCGPQLTLLDARENRLAEKHSALMTAVEHLRDGKIVAIKGIGGYQLCADASSEQAIEQLRLRKHRPQKPLALMTADLASAQQLCFINTLEQQALTSYAAAIVLLKRKEGPRIAKAVAPGSDLLGIMLPYSPLHHLLTRAFGQPLVMTSGNRHNEPICIDNQQALTRLTGIADYFLTHNRPILRPLDDSIVRLIGGKITVLRRARGYTPLPVRLSTSIPDTLAVGGQSKNTIAISHDQHIILSQHLGDLDSEASQQQFLATLNDLQQLYQTLPTRIMQDLHNGYSSNQLAATMTMPKTPVQHHYAHALSCMAEHELEPPLLGIVWDGTGLGSDHTLWGGEFLLLEQTGFQRYAHFRPLPLPGASKAILEPRRSGLGLLYTLFADDLFKRKDLPVLDAFSTQELNLLQLALMKQFNCPFSTSAGRIFDAIASLLGVCQINQYEGQAAMALETLAASAVSAEHYAFHLKLTEPLIIDWQITIEQLLEDCKHCPAELIAVKVHNTLAEIILAIAMRAGQDAIVLSGGCFQNACLAGNATAKLKSAGFQVYSHEKIPPNDGGLAIGQLYASKYTG